ERKRCAARAHRAHRNRTALIAKPASSATNRYDGKTASRSWRGLIIQANFERIKMSKLGQVVGSIENYNKFVLDQVKRARTDRQFGRELLGRWNDTKAKIPVTRTPTSVPLPRLALPEIDDPGEIAR